MPKSNSKSNTSKTENQMEEPKKTSRSGLIFMSFDNRGAARLLLLGVATIAVWRGLWNLQNIYLLPNDPLLSQIVSIIGGLCLFILFREIKL